jgi:hypothetical protein
LDLKLDRKPRAGRHLTVSRGETWLGDLDWKSRWPALLSADATIALASGFFDLRTRRGRPSVSFGGEEVAAARPGGTFSGSFASFRLAPIVSGWEIVSLDGEVRLDAFANGDSFDVEVTGDVNLKKLPLLVLFAHYVWQTGRDQATRWRTG